MTKDTPNYVYIHFSRKGEILYIGITKNLGLRATQHKRESCWFRHVDKITHKKYCSLKAASFAEKRLILKHKPPYNIEYLPLIKRFKVYQNIIPMSVTDDQYEFLYQLSENDYTPCDAARDIFQEALNNRIKMSI